MTARIRVLVVDDSAFARKVLCDLLAQRPEIEVVGRARDGLEALEQIAEHAPDVITLDLMMPGLDGLGVLDAMPQGERGRVLVVSTADSESELAIAALERGAFDLVSKPTALATDRLYELGAELVEKILGLYEARSASAPPPPEPVLQQLFASGPRSAVELIAIGTSTGGPQALSLLLAALPRDFPVPVVVALHIPAGYTDALARRINDASAIEVLEASNGIRLQPGRVVIARGGSHLRVKKLNGELTGWLSNVPSTAAHFPSVDVLFESAAEQVGAGVVGVVLTGMGDDGTRGAAAIRHAGGRVLTESAESCVVYGMPRAVVEGGHSDAHAPLERMAELISLQLAARPRSAV